MAKLGLLFIVIFCIVQITIAARLRRDTVEDGVATIKQTITDTFTKENVDGSFAFVRRDAPAAPAEENNFFKNLLDIGGKIQEAFVETQQGVLKSLGFQSNEEVVQTIQKNTNQYVERLRSVQGVISEEVQKHSDIFEPIVKDLNVKLAETTANLSEQNPELVQKAKEYQQQVQSNLQSLVAEAQKTVEKLKEDTRVPTEELQKALKTLYDSTFETLTKTANELKTKQ
uniref:Apolipophorin-III n=1 Tax=Anopheles dirus TaxID=7168 RepID=A0A182NSF0_9DIPT